MTVLSVARDVCLVIGLDQPDALMSSTDREYVELSRVARNVAYKIASDFDWQALQKVNTYTGDGTTEAFDLPSDYKRMLRNGQMWSSRWIWAFNHIANPDEWLEMQVVPYTFINGNWIVYGGQFHFRPIMQDGETIKFFYMDKNVVQSAGGTFKETFDADDDTLRVPEKLLELGMIWKWRMNKGLPYEEDQTAYEKELRNQMDADAGAKGVVRGGYRRFGRGTRLAFPQTIGGNY